MTTNAHTPGSPNLSVVSTDGEAQSLPQPEPFLYLEVHRGKTGFPQRPVTSRHFLIGSGPACDLRLGGEDIPAAHSLLVVAGDEVRVQWLADSPPLLINGEPAHECELCDGDQIEIGRFGFLVHRPIQEAAEEEVFSSTPASEPMETTSLLNLVSQAKEEETAEDLTDISAEELVERLQTEQEAVEHFEEAVRQGEAALLYAVAQRAADLGDGADNSLQRNPLANGVDDAPGESVDEDLLDELEKVIHQLSGFSSELDQRSKRLANQEATQAEAAELLLDAQKELAAQLERFHQQVTERQELPEPRLRKAA